MHDNSKWKMYSSPLKNTSNNGIAGKRGQQEEPLRQQSAPAAGADVSASPLPTDVPQGPATGEEPVPPKGYLQLYLDNDYILPIAVGNDGKVVKYSDNRGEARLWLYFSKARGKDTYESGAEQRANFYAKLKGNLGDFWQNLATGQKVQGEPYTYADLLEMGGIMERLIDWTRAVLLTDKPAVVLNFATIIGVKARKAFVAYLAQKGMEVRSYSVELNELLALKAADDYQTTLHPVFGSQMLILQSTGRRLLLSTVTWCGNAFMQAEMPLELEMMGEEFRKQQLARIAVEKMEQQMHMLTHGEMEQEVAYQAQFADSWLRSRQDNVIWIEGFHYSMNPSKVYLPFDVNAKLLDFAVSEAMQAVTDQVRRYYKGNVSNHLFTILVGDAFRDEIFTDHCVKVTESENNKSRFFNDNVLQEAMGRYFVPYGTLVENTALLEQRFLTLGQERLRIRQYVKNAESLASMRAAIEKACQMMDEAVAHVKAARADKEEVWKAHMRKSHFDQAKQVVAEMGSSGELTLARQQLLKTITSIEANKSLLADLAQAEQPQVRQLVEEINDGLEQMRKKGEQATQLDELPTHLSKRTQHYEDVYPIYQELRRKLDREPTLKGKQRVLGQMVKDEEGNPRDLTMEPLPIVDVETFAMNISCEVSMKGGGLFSKKKPESLTVTVQVGGGRTLPFPCVLTINGRNQVNLNREGWYADLEKGGQQWTQVIPASSIPTDEQGTCVVQIFPNEDNKHLKESIDYEKRIVKFK